MAILIWSSRFIFSSAFRESWKVLGNKFGKTLSANGSANSIIGMIINMEKGISRNKSEMVRRSCFRSRRVKDDPRRVRRINARAVFKSAQSSYADDYESCSDPLVSVAATLLEIYAAM